MVLAFELLSLTTHTVAVFSRYVSGHIIYPLPAQAYRVTQTDMGLTLYSSLTLNSKVGEFCFVVLFY